MSSRQIPVDNTSLGKNNVDDDSVSDSTDSVVNVEDYETDDEDEDVNERVHSEKKDNRVDSESIRSDDEEYESANDDVDDEILLDSFSDGDMEELDSRAEVLVEPKPPKVAESRSNKRKYLTTSTTSSECEPSKIDIDALEKSGATKSKLRRMKKRKYYENWKNRRKGRNHERVGRIKKTRSVRTEIGLMSEKVRKYNIVIDFSYDNLMNSKDLTKCGNQVVRCYAANRRSLNPVNLHFCSYGGLIEQELRRHDGHDKWDILFHPEHYMNIFDKTKLVYLTSESRNVLETVEEDKVYIIGGLVDHNAHKWISYKHALSNGIAHAQLPVKQNLLMKSRSVLAINHVFEILLKVVNGETWTKALMSAIPARMYHANRLKNGMDSDDEDVPEQDLADFTKAKSADFGFAASKTGHLGEAGPTAGGDGLAIGADYVDGTVSAMSDDPISATTADRSGCGGSPSEATTSTQEADKKEDIDRTSSSVGAEGPSRSSLSSQ